MWYHRAVQEPTPSISDAVAVAVRTACAQAGWSHRTLAARIGSRPAVGISRTAILVAFLVEALCLGAIGGIVGLVAASFMQALAISTTNFQTFAELAFSFTLTPGIVVASFAFALAMGFVGGFLPAARAARLKIVDALRAA